jgi:DNA-directed RNA polymerase sigma subunit (sigma70/sigma32)
LKLEEKRIKEAIEAADISERHKEIILMRYGIGLDRPVPVKDIGKKYKLRGKKLVEEITKVERLAFNILKNQDLYDIMIQNS